MTPSGTWAPDGTIVFAPATGGRFPRWRRDGRELFYWDQDGGLMSVEVDESGTSLSLGAPRKLLHANLVFDSQGEFDIVPDGQHVLLVTRPEGRSSLELFLNWKTALGTR